MKGKVVVSHISYRSIFPHFRGPYFLKFRGLDFLQYFHIQDTFSTTPRCLKITEKVSFNIASEASYVYILNRQKLIKNAKIGPFWRVFLKPEACGQTELPDRLALIGQKLVENAKIEKFKCDVLGDFQTLCLWISVLEQSSVRIPMKLVKNNPKIR